MEKAGSGMTSSKWHLPYSVYEESIDEAISKVQPVPQWYIVLNEDEEIIAGAGSSTMIFMIVRI